MTIHNSLILSSFISFLRCKGRRISAPLQALVMGCFDNGYRNIAIENCWKLAKTAMTIDLNQVDVCFSWRYCLLFPLFKNNSIHVFRMKAYIFQCFVMLLFRCFDRLFKVLELGDCTFFIHYVWQILMILRTYCSKFLSAVLLQISPKSATPPKP